MEILNKISPITEIFRSWVMQLAEVIGTALKVSPENVSIILLVIISLWLPTIFYSAIKQKLNTWLIVSGIIFAIIKFI
jgi:hypothetical protein